MATLEELIRLLDYPTFLAEKIRQLKTEGSVNEEVDGFIVLYDQCNGDIQEIKHYLTVSKQKITGKSLPKIRRLRWVKYAAILVVILGIGTYFTLSKSTKNYYKTYADSDPGLPVFMSIDQHALDQWMLTYKAQNYPIALKTGIQLLQENPTNDTIQYYLGVIQLELNHPTQAQRYFSKITPQRSVFGEQATWLEAICSMYTDKVKAKSMLETIAHSDSFYQAKAKELLAEEF